jgi:hypothetical protein
MPFLFVSFKVFFAYGSVPRDHIPTDKIVRLQFHTKGAEVKINLFQWKRGLELNYPFKKTLTVPSIF